jgi:hypothetical protein
VDFVLVSQPVDSTPSGEFVLVRQSRPPGTRDDSTGHRSCPEQRKRIDHVREDNNFKGQVQRSMESPQIPPTMNAMPIPKGSTMPKNRCQEVSSRAVFGAPGR